MKDEAGAPVPTLRSPAPHPQPRALSLALRPSHHSSHILIRQCLPLLVHGTPSPWGTGPGPASAAQETPLRARLRSQGPSQGDSA